MGIIRRRVYAENDLVVKCVRTGESPFIFLNGRLVNKDNHNLVANEVSLDTLAKKRASSKISKKVVS